MDPCTFPVMHTLSIGLYPFRKGLWNPAHFWTWKLRPLAHIPLGWGTEVLFHEPFTISGLGNSTFCLYPPRDGHRSFYPWNPAHFWTWKLRPLAHIPPGRGTGVFIHGPLHISGHGNSVCWPISLQGGALENLSLNPCTFPNTSVQSINNFFRK